MEKHSCKLCFRRFSNGRALGGHMRSHVAAAAAGVAVAASAVAPAGDSSTSSREAEEDELGDGKGLVLSYGLRENPRKSFRLVDPEFSSSLAAVDAGSSVVQDLESETESPRPVPCHRRRSKRSRRFPPPPPDPEPVSSVSDTTPEEDVAISLMLLSRDVWTKSAEAAEESSDGDDDESEDEQIVAGSGRGGRDSGERRRSRFQCETCKKVFRSYQALGGHRASHKKLKQSCSPAAAVKTRIPEANADRKVHECPVCFRVFGSGQALGGHKRSHLSSSSPSLLPPPSPATAKLGGESLIDLNLPAPMDEDAAELSAVSDASEFVVGNLPSY